MTATPLSAPAGHGSAGEAFEALLAALIRRHGSDLHLAEGRPPLGRVHGELVTLDTHPWPARWMDALVAQFTAGLREQEWQRNGSVDVGYGSAGGERFRINLLRAMGRRQLVARHLDNRFRGMAELGLPEGLRHLADLQDGLVLVTGATGSGKSTTLAALIHEINRLYPKHILTIEDPVEFVHLPIRAAVTHRELHADVPDFATAVRASLREDPDVILIGELRDLETMRAAITAAETGHLVFGTLHTADTVGSVERLVGGFAGDEQDAIRYRLSLCLRAVVSQRLEKRSDGNGRVPLVEILTVTSAISNLIATGRSKQIYSAIESGADLGMQTFDQSIALAVRGGQLTRERGLQLARDARAVERMLLARAGMGAARGH